LLSLEMCPFYRTTNTLETLARSKCRNCFCWLHDGRFANQNVNFDFRRLALIKSHIDKCRHAINRMTNFLSSRSLWFPQHAEANFMCRSVVLTKQHIQQITTRQYSNPPNYIRRSYFLDSYKLLAHMTSHSCLRTALLSSVRKKHTARSKLSVPDGSYCLLISPKRD
jgi:hypothetical protein